MESITIFVTALVLVQQAIAVVPIPRCTRQYEVYNSCGTACPLTCNNYKNPPSVCTMNCVVGCQCGSGYVRNTADGTCCKTSQCPVTTPSCLLSHEVYDACGSACPRTCNNYKNPPMACTANCVVGCRCEGEYVRNTADGTCCLPSECPT